MEEMDAAAQDVRRLEDLLGHRFRAPALLQEALTHASSTEGHNERLEHLGDAVLNLVATEMLFARRPGAREGVLTQAKSLLVSRENLARVGARLGLEAWLRVGGGVGSAGVLPRSLLGNAVESLIGAVWLDAEGAGASGYATCRAVATRWLEPDLADLPLRHARAHAKMLLQDWAQAHGHPPPEYRVSGAHEHPLTRSFRIVARAAGREFPPAWAASKREAERLAAWEAVQVLRAEGEEIGGHELA